MSRSDQYIGFTEEGNSLIEDLYEQKSCPTCTHTERKLKEGITVNKYDEIDTAFDEGGYGLHEFFKDGKLIFKEVSQATPWYSGPMYFLKLVDSNGKDLAAWDEIDIERESTPGYMLFGVTGDEVHFDDTFVARCSKCESTYTPTHTEQCEVSEKPIGHLPKCGCGKEVKWDEKL